MGDEQLRLVYFVGGRDQSTREQRKEVPEASSNGSGCHRGQPSYEPGGVQWIFLAKYLGGVRSEERICVEFAYHEM